MNQLPPNARDFLDSIIVACAKLQEHPTYLGFIKCQLIQVDDLITEAVERVEELIEAGQ